MHAELCLNALYSKVMYMHISARNDSQHTHTHTPDSGM